MLLNDPLLLFYRRLLRIRAFETRVSELAAAGELPSPISSALGREATVVAACAALTEEDLIVAALPSHGILLARDVPMDRLMAELLGRATGTNRGRAGWVSGGDGDRRIFAAWGQRSEGAASSALLAAGAALAMRWRDDGQIVLAEVDDGASQGDGLDRAMALAGELALPVIFLRESDGAADGSMPEAALGGADLTARAEACGIAGVSVDGGDLLAVYAAVEEAARRARAGGGATFVEARTYRWSASPDPSSSARRPDDPGIALKQDPIERFIVYLAAHGAADEAHLARIAREVDDELHAAVEFARASPLASSEVEPADIYA